VQREADERSQVLNNNPDGYEVLVRGYQDGELVQRRDRAQSISRVLAADQQWPEVLEFARSPNLRFIVSNATESGYVIDPSDQLGSVPPKTLAGKLAQALRYRHKWEMPPVTILPCELIEHNADKLRELVTQQSQAWRMPDPFVEWIRHECVWFNSLVDCIVTLPEPELARMEPLLICAEPYHLWALEVPNKPGAQATGDTASLPSLALRACMCDDIAPFFLRKVRILNGTHTAMVGKFLSQFETVQQLLADKAAARWVRDLMYEEIVPTLAYRLVHVAEFADQTYDRLRNPYTNHKLADIAKGHADKVRIRLEPTRREYEQLFGKPPKRIAEITDQSKENQP
jgi:tagaturonate reductase